MNMKQECVHYSGGSTKVRERRGNHISGKKNREDKENAYEFPRESFQLTLELLDPPAPLPYRSPHPARRDGSSRM